MKAKNTKSTVMFSIEEDVINQFKITCKIKDITYSEVIENLMQSFIITNKAEINEKIKKIYGND